jgi:DNA-binding transcriptional LysR family regulator
VLSLQQLSALDLYLWLEREELVGAALGCHQSSVSRNMRASVRLFDLRLTTVGPHPRLDGDDTLLQAQRAVHQQARLRGMAPLRLDATYSSGPWLLPEVPPGWMLGRFDLPGIERPLTLLRERVIDAWVGSYQPDLPDPDDREWWVLDLLREPVRLLASPDHPLARERGLGAGDLAPFPSLGLPEGWFPRTEASLRAQGLWSDPVRIMRYDASCWEGRCADGVTLTYGQSLTEALQPSTVRLDWDLGLITGEALVVRRDLANTAPIQALAEALLKTSAQVAARFDDVERPG